MTLSHKSQQKRCTSLSFPQIKKYIKGVLNFHQIGLGSGVSTTETLASPDFGFKCIETAEQFTCSAQLVQA